MYDITALGEILIDFTYQGENEDGQKLFAQNPGGAPANALTAASRLGASCAFLGKAGDDMHGRFLKETLIKEKIHTGGFLLDPNFFTTLAFVALTPEGERRFSFARKPGADTQLSREELSPDVLKHTKIFHVGSLSLTDEPARGTTMYAVQTARENGSLISYDPNYRASLWRSEEDAKEQMRSLIPYVDIMKISDEETALLTGHEDPDEAADALLAQGVSCVLVTLGSQGALMKTEKFRVQEKGKARKAVDTTGAGDAFWGGILSRFAFYSANPKELTEEQGREFVRFANAVAGLCVEKRGAIPAMPTLEQVMNEL